MSGSKKSKMLPRDVAPIFRFLCARITEELEDAATIASRGQKPDTSFADAAAIARVLSAHARRLDLITTSIGVLAKLPRRR